MLCRSSRRTTTRHNSMIHCDFFVGSAPLWNNTNTSNIKQCVNDKKPTTGSKYGAHPVGDDEDGFVFYEPGQSLLNGSFVFHIQTGGGFVQQNDGRILQEARAMEMR